MAKRRLQKTKYNWSFFIILLLAVLVFGLLIIFWSIQRPFCASSDNCKESMQLNVQNGVAGVFNGQKVVPPTVDLSQKEPKTAILGEATVTGEKHIYVDLGNQTLTAYQGDALFMQVPVSTGKWGKTPIGDFAIWEKFRAVRMSGGSGADYYNLPNVPYTMFFSGPNAAAGAGFSLHGTYWHNNFGHPMSHGCVNMKIVDAQRLYDWVNPITKGSATPATKDDPGTKITIYGQAPL